MPDQQRSRKGNLSPEHAGSAALLAVGILVGGWLLSAAGCENGREEKASKVDAATATADSTPSGADTQPSSDPRARDIPETSATAKPSVELKPTLLPEGELAAGWISLFDGQTLFGWEAASKANWRVEDGVIVVDQGEKGLLCTTTQFADYVLRVDFRSAQGTNSGVFLRTPRVVEGDDVTNKCYELNIAPPENPFPTGSFVKRQKAAGTFDSRDWQTFEVTALGPEIAVQIDGQEVLRYTDPKPVRRGFIGLQLNEGKVEFRNVKLKPLALEPIFNGRDLAGWTTYPDKATQFTVTSEGYLNAKNQREARGQLETVKSYGDFVLQMECLTHAPRLNSGVFFRCIPGEEMNGYECQIHNGYHDGDRSKPQDCGTGGIFRRQDARWVVADDEKWFPLTLIADGPHMAAWVGGFQVSDWTDTRAPHVNPRNGRRLEAGTIMLQGHDATTNISFRNLRAVELPQ